MKSRILLFAIFVFGSFQIGFGQETDLARYIRANYTKREVMIPVRDGVRLFTAIYEPKDKSKIYPIMLNRTPYTVRPYGEDEFRNSLGPSELFVREGYIFVYQDVRGRWRSEGVFEDVRPDIDNRTPQQIDESTDTYDSIEWLLKDIPNDNGRVGMWGISYPGFYTSAGAIDSHPALKAISPQAPVSDWFHGDDMHHNGALFLAQNFAFFTSFGQFRPEPTDKTDYIKPWNGRRTPDGYDNFLRLGGLKEVSDYYEKAVGTRIKFWDEMMAHPNYDDWWKARNILPKLKNIKAAVMTVGGWYDNEDLFGALRTYQHIERQNPGIFNVLVIGPWDHGGWSRGTGEWLGTAHFGQKTSEWYRGNLEFPFFQRFLKDQGSADKLREVNLFDTGANRWMEFSSYQPERTTESRLYLTAGGGLTFDEKAAAAKPDKIEYVSDPMKPVPYTQKITANYPRDYMTEDQRFASTRPDVLVFQSEPLTEDVVLAGDVSPTLFVSSTGTDADFIVKLIDVFPDEHQFAATDRKLPNGQPERVKPPENSAWTVFAPGGYQMLLRGEPMPARFRNSFEKPEPLDPNRVAEVRFTMPGVAHTFKKGHRIMIQIQSTWFPLVARNPQKFMPNYKMGTQADFRKETQRIHVGKGSSSFIGVRRLEN